MTISSMIELFNALKNSALRYFIFKCPKPILNNTSEQIEREFTKAFDSFLESQTFIEDRFGLRLGDNNIGTTRFPLKASCLTGLVKFLKDYRV